MITAPLGEGEAIGFFPACGMAIGVAGGQHRGKEELSGLARRVRGDRETLKAARKRDRREFEATGSNRQASGRGSVPYLLFLLPVLHGRTEVLSPVCLPWAGSLSLTVLPSGRAEPSKRQPLAWAGKRRQEPRFRGEAEGAVAMAMVAVVASRLRLWQQKLLHLPWLPEVGNWGAGKRVGVRGP